jgi:hypothetical protein
LKNKKNRGFIVFLDALGTKHIHHTNYYKKIFEWDKIVRFNDIVVKEINKQRKRNYKIETFAFTDFIVIVHPIDENKQLIEEFDKLGDCLNTIMSSSLEKQILFRGAISYGIYQSKNSLIIGTAVDEVVSWYEESDWIGVHTTPSLKYELSKIIDKSMQNFLLCNTPCKSVREYKSWALNWPSFYVNSKEIKNDAIQKVKELIIADNTAIDTHLYNKIENTFRFIEQSVGQDT